MRSAAPSTLRRPGTSLVFAVETLEGERVGFSGLHGIDWANGWATTGTLIGKEYWGRGFGRDSAKLRARYAFAHLGLRGLESQVFAENTRSLRMLKGVGYREVGRLPKRSWKAGGLEGFSYSRSPQGVVLKLL